MTEQTEITSVDELAAILETAGGKVVDFDLERYMEQEVADAWADRDACKEIREGLNVALVSPGSSRMRLHGLAKDGAFLHFVDADGYTERETAVVYFKRHQDAWSALRDELWVS